MTLWKKNCSILQKRKNRWTWYAMLLKRKILNLFANGLLKKNYRKELQFFCTAVLVLARPKAFIKLLNRQAAIFTMWILAKRSHSSLEKARNVRRRCSVNTGACAVLQKKQTSQCQSYCSTKQMVSFLNERILILQASL